MRRDDRQIDNLEQLEAIIDKAKVCRLGLNDRDLGLPYIVPLSFGYQAGYFFFHSSAIGTKLDLIREQKRASFEIDICHGVIRRERACAWTMRYSSIMGWGDIRLIEDTEDKQKALQVLMNHYGTGRFFFPEDQIDKTTVFELQVRKMTGKTSEGK